MEEGVGLEHILFACIGHGLCEGEKVLVVLLALEVLDLLGGFLIGPDDHGAAVFEVVKLYHLHS